MDNYFKNRKEYLNRLMNPVSVVEEILPKRKDVKILKLPFSKANFMNNCKQSAILNEVNNTLNNGNFEVIDDSLIVCTDVQCIDTLGFLSFMISDKIRRVFTENSHARPFTRLAQTLYQSDSITSDILDDIPGIMTVNGEEKQFIMNCGINRDLSLNILDNSLKPADYIWRL